MTASDENDYDLILIGSGMGALATGSILAQLRGQRVLMLERHYVLGGFTHEFQRRQDGKKYSWDVGIHYVGEMGEDGLLRRLFDIITRNGVLWNAMPDIFEKFVYPDFTFPVPSSEDRYRAAVIEKFPEEREAIETYFEDIRSVDGWFGRHNMKSAQPFVDRIKSPCPIRGFDTADITAGQYMDANFQDPKLKAMLLSQWGDYGIPPGRCAFVIHASVVRHYFKGGYFPVGGAGIIAESVRPIIEENGGQILLSHEVEEILVEDGRAVGVRVRKLTARKDEPAVREFRAPLVISNAGAHITYTKLLPASVPIPFREALQRFYQEHPVSTAVTLYLGLERDPRELGFFGENHWMFSGYDHDQYYANAGDWLLGDAEPGGLYLSFPSLKNPKAASHTAEVIALIPHEPFASWNETKWKRRGEEYEKLKQNIARKMLAFVERGYPGFEANVIYQELSTPLSVAHFTDHPHGSIYGVPSVRERFRSDLAPWCQARTPVENLFLTGADASSPGIAGALMGAMATIGQVPGGISFIRVLKEAGNLQKRAPADA